MPKKDYRAVMIMMKIQFMKKRLIFFAILLILSENFGYSKEAIPMNTFKSDSGFWITYPANWKKGQDQEGFTLILNTIDEYAEVRVAVYKFEDEVSISKVMENLEKNLGVKNLYQEEQKICPDEELERVGAENGEKGLFELETEAGLVYYQVNMYVFENRFFIVGSSVLARYQKRYVSAINSIVLSFKILPLKEPEDEDDKEEE